MTDEVGPVEHGIPIPPKSGGKYGWDELAVGDSRVVRSLSAVQSGRQWAKRHGVTFEVRRILQSPYGYRVWRVT